MKYTKHTLKKIEDLFGEIDYTIRYERGNFQSGYCLVENRRIAVVNKFYDTEARINCLLEILSIQEVDLSTLSEKGADLFKKLRKLTATAEKEGEEGEEVSNEETADAKEETIVDKSSPAEDTETENVATEKIS